MTKRLGLIVLVGMLTAGGIAAQAVPDGFKSVSDQGFLFAWRIVGDDLEVIMAQRTRGWIAVGFEPERIMRGANMVIGYVSGNEVVVEDHYGHRLANHAPDVDLGGTSDVTVISGVESGGRTEIRFRIPLDSGDEYDKPLARGRETHVIFAWGGDGSDNFRDVHRGHGSFRVRL